MASPSALERAVEAFWASGGTSPAAALGVLLATKALLPSDGSADADAHASAIEANSSSTSTSSTPSPAIAIASLVRCLGQDLTSADDARRAASTQLLAQVRDRLARKERLRVFVFFCC